jgi:hypothetical protein
LRNDNLILNHGTFPFAAGASPAALSSASTYEGRDDNH